MPVDIIFDALPRHALETDVAPIYAEGAAQPDIDGDVSGLQIRSSLMALGPTRGRVAPGER